MTTLSVEPPTFEHHRDPLGIGETAPRLSWIVTTASAAGGSRRTRSSSATERATGRSSPTNPCSCPGPARSWARASGAPPGCVCTVATARRATGARGPGRDRAARPGRLARGRGGAAAGTAGPARRSRPAAAPRLQPCARPSSQARLYVTAHGLYELEINGTPVGDDVLAPGWTSYHHRLRYQTYDVTELLRDGRQRHRRDAGRRLVPGPARLRRRQKRRLRRPHGAARAAGDRLRRRHDRPGRHRRRLALRARPGHRGRPVRRREPTTPGCCRPAGRRPASTTPPGCPRRCSTTIRPGWSRPPARRCAGSRRSRPWRCSPGRPGETILDFGQNLVRPAAHPRAGPGRAHGLAAARRGARRRRAGACGRSAPQPRTTRYTLRGERRPEELGAALHLPRLPLRRDRRLARRARPGRRRAPWSATPTCAAPAGSPAPTRCSTGCTRTSCGACAATSSTSRPTARSATSGSAGPATSRSSPRPPPSSTTAPACSRSWLDDLAAEQRRDGTVPLFVPWVELGPFTAAQPTAAWGDAAVVVPWALYQRTGDLDLLRSAVRRACAPGWTRSPSSPASRLLWDTGAPARRLARPRRAAGPAAETPHRPEPRRHRLPGPLGPRWSPRPPSVLGHADGRRRLPARSPARVRRGVRRRVRHPDGRWSSDSQTAYALALRFGLLTDGAERRRRRARGWPSWSARTATASAPASSARR